MAHDHLRVNLTKSWPTARLPSTSAAKLTNWLLNETVMRTNAAGPIFTANTPDDIRDWIAVVGSALMELRAVGFPDLFAVNEAATQCGGGVSKIREWQQKTAAMAATEAGKRSSCPGWAADYLSELLSDCPSNIKTTSSWHRQLLLSFGLALQDLLSPGKS